MDQTSLERKKPFGNKISLSKSTGADGSRSPIHMEEIAQLAQRESSDSSRKEMNLRSE